MSYFKVDIFPLEPYTFGTDQGAKYEGAIETGKENYIIATSEMPEQTTIWGTLRYLVLKKKDKIRTDYKYNQSELEEIGKLVGKESFSFNKSNQDFGVLKQISPVYISDESGSKFVKSPYCNTADTDSEYKPLNMSDGLCTSYGENLHYPNNYDPKKGYSYGFINLIDGKFKDNSFFFSKKYMVGNRSDSTTKDEGFFKREVIILKEGYNFSVNLQIDDDIFSDGEILFANMGKKSNLFRFEFSQISEDEFDISASAKSEIFKLCDKWYYAVSDVYVGDQDFKLCEFAMVEKKTIRNLETNLSEERYVNKRKKNMRYNLIASGSSFYKIAPDYGENENCKKIGLNYFIELGGK